MSDYPMISIFLHLSQAPNPLPHVLSNTLLMHPVISLSAVSSGIFFLHTPEPSIPHSVSHIQNPNCILLFQVLSALHWNSVMSSAFSNTSAYANWIAPYVLTTSLHFFICLFWHLPLKPFLIIQLSSFPKSTAKSAIISPKTGFPWNFIPQKWVPKSQNPLNMLILRCFLPRNIFPKTPFSFFSMSFHTPTLHFFRKVDWKNNILKPSKTTTLFYLFLFKFLLILLQKFVKTDSTLDFFRHSFENIFCNIFEHSIVANGFPCSRSIQC